MNNPCIAVAVIAAVTIVMNKAAATPAKNRASSSDVGALGLRST